MMRLAKPNFSCDDDMRKPPEEEAHHHSHSARTPQQKQHTRVEQMRKSEARGKLRVLKQNHVKWMEKSMFDFHFIQNV